MDSGRLKGKVALVTGGSRGIGRAIALALAEEGAKVAINYSSGAREAEEVSKLVDQLARVAGVVGLYKKIDEMETVEETEEVSRVTDQMGRASYVCQANVADFEQIQRMVKEIEQNLGKIDILVNNAGITKDKPLVKMTPEMWKAVLSVNLDGVFYCTKAVVEGMIERGWGRIINISSVVGRMGNFGQANYAASKAGVIGFTKTLAKELAQKGITVNAIAPGYIETRMLEPIPLHILDRIIAQIPLGRLGRPMDVARAVVYLTSEDGDYITGQILDVNGGLYI